MWLEDVVAEVKNALADVEDPLLSRVPWRREAIPSAPLAAATREDSNFHAISSASNATCEPDGPGNACAVSEPDSVADVSGELLKVLGEHARSTVETPDQLLSIYGGRRPHFGSLSENG